MTGRHPLQNRPQHDLPGKKKVYNQYFTGKQRVSNAGEQSRFMIHQANPPPCGSSEAWPL
jgi:hypothetical protein